MSADKERWSSREDRSRARMRALEIEQRRVADAARMVAFRWLARALDGEAELADASPPPKARTRA